MDLREAKLILEKINRLFESMSLDERKIDTFEQDLMLSYTKQFHDSFSYEQENAIPQPIRRKAPPRIIEPPVVATPPAPPVAKVEPAPVEAPKAEPVPEPVPVMQSAPEPVAKKTSPPIIKIPASVAKATAATAPEVKKTPAPTKLAPNMEELFATKGGNELSEKLSQMPIKDLNKSLSINERILTINELFGKDADFFSEVLNKLNEMSSFDQAKSVLVQMAQKYDWVAPEKKKKANIFIKLVRRRYL